MADATLVDSLLEELFQHPADEWPRRLDVLAAAHPAEAAEVRRRYRLLCSTGLDRDPTFARSPELPEQLGEFRLLRRLGAGGMGMVFVAEQTSLGRQVVLKVVRPELLLADAARERFRREIEAVARLDHPAIVPVLTHGEERGVPYYVMPQIQGRPCDQVIDALAGRDPDRLEGRDLQRAIVGDDAHGPDPDGVFAGTWWQACLRLLRQVALGLQHAHSRGIVHRDVKPSNILLTGDGRALLVDFGLAHARDDARITRSGATLGSPAYMSPEQVRGRASDERTDVYSLAATLHHLLALAPPFALDDAEVLRLQVLAGTRQPLRNAALPPELRTVLAAAMDIDREQRHADAGALADDLQAVLEQRPIRARPLPWTLRARRFCARHPTASVGLAALLLLAVALPTALWWQQRTANLALAAATARAERGFQRSLQVIDDMLLRAGAEKLLNVPAAQAVAADLVRRAVEHFDRAALEEGDASAFRSRHVLAIEHLSEFELCLGHAAPAEALARRALAMLVADADSAETRQLRAQARFQLATMLEQAGKNDDATRLAVDAEHELDAVAADLPVEAQRSACDLRARLLNLRGGLHEKAGNDAAADTAFAAALSTCRDLVARFAAGQRIAAVAAYNLARLARRRGDLAHAALLLDEATAWVADLDPDVGAWPTPAMVRALLDAERGRVLLARRDGPGARAAFAAAVEQGQRLVVLYPHLPNLRRDLGSARSNLGLVLNQQDEAGPAREQLVAAVDDLEQTCRAAPSDDQAPLFLLNARKNLCVALRSLGDHAALADAARAYGRMPGGPDIPRGAARDLLRCAASVGGNDAARLHDEAIALLLESEHRGWGKAGLDDELYAPLATDPRFVALRARLDRSGR